MQNFPATNVDYVTKVKCNICSSLFAENVRQNKEVTVNVKISEGEKITNLPAGQISWFLFRMNILHNTVIFTGLGKVPGCGPWSPSLLGFCS